MPARLRIGVNALYLIPEGVGGTEIYLRNLLKALARIDRRNQYLLFLNRETEIDLCPREDNFIPVETGVRGRFRPGRLLWEQVGLPGLTMESKIDVLFSPGFTSPRYCRGGKVTVIHDLQHKRQPQNFGFFERMAWNSAVRQSARHSDEIVTVSESSKRDIVDVYRVPEERVHVVPHGVEEAFFGLLENPKYPPNLPLDAGLPGERYLLAVSTVHPHKNWDRLIGAFARLRADGSQLHLAICGLKGNYWKSLEGLVAEKGLEESVHLLGWQPRQRLIGLFKYADALVFPSTFEGFGMPVAEALAAKLPVACSDIQPLREIADGCAVFFNPESEEEIVAAVRRILHDKDARIANIRRGEARAAGFSWTRAAEQTLKILLNASRR